MRLVVKTTAFDRRYNASKWRKAIKAWRI